MVLMNSSKLARRGAGKEEENIKKRQKKCKVKAKGR